MSFDLEYLDYIQRNVDTTLGGLSGKRMLELGSQGIPSKEIPESSGKKYYENRGVSHTSFDLNGHLGALRVDLSKPINEDKWLGYFDIMTNMGTSEHVEPFEGQYNCFMNIHNVLKPGGIMIHLVPDVNELEQRDLWKGHCNYYYSHAFFSTLSKLNGYELLSSEVINGLRCVCLQKDATTPFTSDKQKVLESISVRSGDGALVYIGINDPWFMRPITHHVLKPLYRVTRPLRHKLGLTRLNLTQRHNQK